MGVVKTANKDLQRYIQELPLQPAKEHLIKNGLVQSMKSVQYHP